jgi:hypothetical protein
MFLVVAFHRFRRDRDRRDERHRNNDGRATLSVQITDAARGERGQIQETDRHICDARSMPLLYALAKSWAWGAVEFRCQTHPEEAAMNWTDSHGDNVLHWSVFGKPPLSPVQNILTACPDLAKVRNNRGLFPLHGTHTIPASLVSWTGRSAERYALYSSNFRLLSSCMFLPRLSRSYPSYPWSLPGSGRRGVRLWILSFTFGM